MNKSIICKYQFRYRFAKPLQSHNYNNSSQHNDPYLYRFTQPDSIIPNLYTPQNFNRYGYVVNNPLRYNDPSGYMCSDPQDEWSPSCDGADNIGEKQPIRSPTSTISEYLQETLTVVPLEDENNQLVTAWEDVILTPSGSAVVYEALRRGVDVIYLEWGDPTFSNYVGCVGSEDSFCTIRINYDLLTSNPEMMELSRVDMAMNLAEEMFHIGSGYVPPYEPSRFEEYLAHYQANMVRIELIGLGYLDSGEVYQFGIFPYDIYLLYSWTQSNDDLKGYGLLPSFPYTPFP